MLCWTDFSSASSSGEQERDLTNDKKVSQPLLRSTIVEPPTGEHIPNSTTPSESKSSESNTDDYEFGNVDYIQHQQGSAVIISNKAAASFQEREQLHLDLMEASSQRKPSRRLGKKKNKNTMFVGSAFCHMKILQMKLKVFFVRERVKFVQKVNLNGKL